MGLIRPIGSKFVLFCLTNTAKEQLIGFHKSCIFAVLWISPRIKPLMLLGNHHTYCLSDRVSPNVTSYTS